MSLYPAWPKYGLWSRKTVLFVQILLSRIRFRAVLILIDVLEKFCLPHFIRNVITETLLKPLAHTLLFFSLLIEDDKEKYNSSEDPSSNSQNVKTILNFLSTNLTVTFHLLFHASDSSVFV